MNRATRAFVNRADAISRRSFLATLVSVPLALRTPVVTASDMGALMQSLTSGYVPVTTWQVTARLDPAAVAQIFGVPLELLAPQSVRDDVPVARGDVTADDDERTHGAVDPDRELLALQQEDGPGLVPPLARDVTPLDDGLEGLREGEQRRSGDRRRDGRRTAFRCRARHGRSVIGGSA